MTQHVLVCTKHTNTCTYEHKSYIIRTPALIHTNGYTYTRIIYNTNSCLLELIHAYQKYRHIVHNTHK